MEPTEAIKIIEIAVAEVEWNYPMDYTVAFEAAVDALIKQIPAKPINNYKDKWFECPSCGLIVGTYYDIKENHHCQCGQALDWQEVE